MRASTAFSIAAVAALVSTPAVAQKALKPHEGAALFTYRAPDTGKTKFLATFTFAPFDVANGRLVDGGKTGKHVPQVKEWPLTGVKLAPGNYVLRDIFLYAGSSSAYCFGAGTVAFEVKPGEVTYLGELSFKPAAPPSGLVAQALGLGGQWQGQVIHSAGDRTAAGVGLAQLFKAPLSAAGASAATFATEGRPKSELGRDCAAAKLMQ